MTKTKITKKDYYNAIITAMQTGNYTISLEEIVEFVNKEIENLEKKAAKAKENAAKKRAEGDELKSAVQATLTNEPQLIADITEAVSTNYPEVTAAKVSYRLSRLVKDGVAVKSTVLIDGESKKRQLAAYSLA